MTLGHEMSGLLDDGTPVVVEPIAACSHCTACGAGQQQLCCEVMQRIYGVALDGGIADEVTVDSQWPDPGWLIRAICTRVVGPAL